MKDLGKRIVSRSNEWIQEEKSYRKKRGKLEKEKIKRSLRKDESKKGAFFANLTHRGVDTTHMLFIWWCYAGNALLTIPWYCC